MLVKDFVNNPKRIALLIKAYNEVHNVISDGDFNIDDWDYQYNDREYNIASKKLEIEMDYPNDSWSKLEFAIGNDDNEFKTVESIPWGTSGVLYVYDSAGKYSEWWI